MREYLLGILDGEGSICSLTSKTKSGRSYTNIRVGVQMCSLEVCELLQKEWGGHISQIKRLSGPFQRQMWGWELNGLSAEPCLLYMAEHSLTKQPQAVLALQLIKTLSVGSSNQWGVNGIPDGLSIHREMLAKQISRLNRGAPNV